MLHAGLEDDIANFLGWVEHRNGERRLAIRLGEGRGDLRFAGEVVEGFGDVRRCARPAAWLASPLKRAGGRVGAARNGRLTAGLTKIEATLRRVLV